jgi:histidyl-tRNA synthetase
MFETLPGFREFYPEACARRNFLFSVWKDVARTAGFQEFDVPLLEPLELYIEKSGEEIVTQLFNFTDKGGRSVSLRPELTPSLARLIGAKANSLKRPVKCFLIGENFRYEKPQKGRLRSHYQLNCDIFGELGPGADAELIGTCLQVLSRLGLSSKDIVLRLSDRCLWIEFLRALGFEDAQALQVLAIVDKMEREERSKTLEKLDKVVASVAADLLAKIEVLVSIRSLAELQSFFETNSAMTVAMTARLKEWADLLDRLSAMGWSDFVRLDLGIVRGLAYYTGFVFEVFEMATDGLRGRAVAGGGRYDHLVKKLGYTDMPAVGFGMGDVVLADLLQERGYMPELIQKPDVYLISGASDSERNATMSAVRHMRDASICVEYPLKSVAFGKQFKAASQSGARWALIIGGDEVASGEYKLKDLQAGVEYSLPAVGWVSVLRERLQNPQD